MKIFRCGKEDLQPGDICVCKVDNDIFIGKVFKFYWTPQEDLAIKVMNTGRVFSFNDINEVHVIGE